MTFWKILLIANLCLLIANIALMCEGSSFAWVGMVLNLSLVMLSVTMMKEEKKQ